MLDAMQNTILNKPDTATKRPNSPTAEISKLESKFEDMFAKAAKNKASKDSESTQKAQDKLGIKEQDSKTSLKRVEKTAKQGIPPLEPTNTESITNPKDKAKNTKAVSPLKPFDFQDSDVKDSKIALQEKIKSTKEAKTEEINPLVEALSAPLANKELNKNTSKDTKTANNESPTQERKGQNIATNKANDINNVEKSPAERLTTMPMPQKMTNIDNKDNKTLADVEKLAIAKGLNPSNITLTKEGEKPKENAIPKQKVIPESAKESIAYEYENNVDRIAIIKRGANKPKNITSKISNEYPSKKAEDENVSDVFHIKDRPQIG